MTTLFRAARRRPLGKRTARRRFEHPVCHDLASWAAWWPGAERWVIQPPFVTSRPLPKTIEPEVEASFVPLCSVHVPERALVKIPNARLRGEIGLVVLPNGELAGELVALTREGRHAMLRPEPAYHERLPSRARKKRGNFYPVLGFGVSHYYHWSHDLIMGARGIAPRLPSDTQLIVPETMRPFQIETLALLRLDDHPQVHFPSEELWELENLYVVTPRLKTQIDSSEPFRWFRAAAMDRYGLREAKPTRRFYLSRKHDNHWRTTNEPEVEDFLGERGFETVTPGLMTFRAQIELFGQAEIIVGTGAGLFNMVFAPPTVKVLQFQENNRWIHSFWTAAAALDFDYRYLLCDSVPNSAHRVAGIPVPIDKLDASLVAMTAF